MFTSVHICRVEISVIAGLLGGLTLGVFGISQTEVRKREFLFGNPPTPISGGGMLFEGILAILFSLLKCLPTLAVVPLVFYLGGVPYSKEITPSFGVAYICGVAGGKYSRYLYWRAR